MYRWWVFVHIVGVVGFLLAHGTSATIALRIRQERDVARIQALLELSSATIGALYISIVLILTGGIIAGFLGHWWTEGWIWASLGVLIGLIVAMYPLGTNYFDKVRESVGVQTYQQKRKGIEAGPRKSDDEIAAILASPRAYMLAVLGVGGLLVIVWLMVLMPF